MKTLFLALFAIGCGGGGGTPVQDAPTCRHRPQDAAVDSKVFMDGPSGTTPLTVKNIDSWCAVTVNGGAPDDPSSQRFRPPVRPSQLTATPNPADGSTFELGPAHTWFKTDGDTGGGDPGTSVGGGTQPTNTATVTVGTTAKCIYACCPFSDGTGCNVGGTFVPTDPCL